MLNSLAHFISHINLTRWTLFLMIYWTWVHHPTISEEFGSNTFHREAVVWRSLSHRPAHSTCLWAKQLVQVIHPTEHANRPTQCSSSWYTVRSMTPLLLDTELRSCLYSVYLHRLGWSGTHLDELSVLQIASDGRREGRSHAKQQTVHFIADETSPRGNLVQSLKGVRLKAHFTIEMVSEITL